MGVILTGKLRKHIFRFPRPDKGADHGSLEFFLFYRGENGEQMFDLLTGKLINCGFLNPNLADPAVWSRALYSVSGPWLDWNVLR